MADASLRASGIYAIRNTVNGKAYVGSAVNIQRRWWQHTSRLNLGTHHSAKLQSAWIKYGAAAFSFDVVEYVADAVSLIEREQHWIEMNAAFGPSGYNMRALADSSLGTKASQEAKAKRSAALRGRTLTQDHRAKIAEAGKGRRFTENERAKISAAHMGKKKTPMSEDARARLSAARLGMKKRPMSEEQKAKLSAIHSGKKRSPPSAETRAKISASKLGKPYGKRPQKAA